MQRITKQKAQKLFAEGKPIILCPNKLRAGGPWHPECTVTLEHYLPMVQYYQETNSTLWKGTPAATAWELMYNNWNFYNTGNGMGDYAHYYIK